MHPPALRQVVAEPRLAGMLPSSHPAACCLVITPQVVAESRLDTRWVPVERLSTPSAHQVAVELDGARGEGCVRLQHVLAS